MTQDQVRNIIMDAVIIAAVAVQVVMVFDDATNGDFTRELGNKFVRLRGRIQEEIKRERFFRKNIGRYIWDAISIVENERPTDNDNDSGETSIPE